MPKKSARAAIAAYRKSGRMFGDTFHTGRAHNETPDARMFGAGVSCAA